MCVRESEKRGHFYFIQHFFYYNHYKIASKYTLLYTYPLLARIHLLSFLFLRSDLTMRCVCACVRFFTLHTCVYRHTRTHTRVCTDSCPALLHNCFWLAIDCGCLCCTCACVLMYVFLFSVCIRSIISSFRHITAYLHAHLLL